MRVFVTGSHGFIGSALADRLRTNGHQVVALVRAEPGPGERRWDPASDLDPEVLEGADAVVHLAGAGIADRRWNQARRTVIRDSRVHGTQVIAAAIAALPASRRPATLLAASAIGYYGDRGDEELTEASPPGSGFLAELCRDWEAAAATAAGGAGGTRVVHLRTGIVLDRSGGILARQLRLFRLGLGGRLGSGRQWTSWISLTDAVGAIVHLLHDTAVAGPVNLTAPEPVTNAVFARALGAAVHRPAVLRVPTTVLRLALGAQLVDEAIMASARALPCALQRAGYVYAHPELALTLDSLLS